MTTGDILIFVEDPGAANGLMDLPPALAARGVGARIAAAGHAVQYLAGFGIEAAPVDAADDAASLLDAGRSRMVVAGTSENRGTLGLKLIAEARRRGLPSVGFVDGPASAEYRFRGTGDGPLAFAPDWILVADDLTRRRFQALGVDAARMQDVGHPYFDRVRETGAALARRGRAAVRAKVMPDAPAGRPVLVFLAESDDGLEPADHRRGRDYTLAGRGGADERVPIVLEEVLDALAPVDPRPYVVLRLHPKNRDRDFAAYADEVDLVSRAGPAAEVVFAADLTVGLTSIAVLEAALLGCPTLSVIPRPGEADWLAAIGLGITPCVHTRDALLDTLPAALADPGRVVGKPPDEVLHFGALERMTVLLCRLLAGAGAGPAEKG